MPKFGLLSKRFGADESGAATIEFVIWLPFLLVLLFLSVNAAVLMHTQTLLYDAARDAARQVATGAATTAEAASAAQARFQSAMGVSADVAISGEFVRADLSVPYTKVLVLGGPMAGDWTLGAAVTMWVEQDDAS